MRKHRNVYGSDWSDCRNELWLQLSQQMRGCSTRWCLPLLCVTRKKREPANDATEDQSPTGLKIQAKSNGKTSMLCTQYGSHDDASPSRQDNRSLVDSNSYIAPIILKLSSQYGLLLQLQPHKRSHQLNCQGYSHCSEISTSLSDLPLPYRASVVQAENRKDRSTQRENARQVGR